MVVKNWEQIKLITKQIRKGVDEQKVMCYLEEGDFRNYLEINKNNLFNEIVDFILREGYYFVLIKLANATKYNEAIIALCNRYPALKDKEFLGPFVAFLKEVAQCEKDGKEYLISTQNDEFSDVFFNYNHGSDSNLHGSLNINFTEHTQCLNVTSIFEKEENRMVENECKLKKLILYDNGHKSVIIEKNSDKENYLFTPGSSCQLIINRLKESDAYTFFLDIISGEVINVEFKSCGILNNLINKRDVLAHNEKLFIENQNISETLTLYFDNEIEEHETLQDQCLPIKSLDDLKNWKPPVYKHITAPLRKRAVDKYDIKILVCHDMKGGYLQDSFVDGVKEENCYFFVHWAAVDIFGYFSHHLVTIPPCSWISAAHLNGVQIIGTFITEWDEGVKICEKVFTDKKSVNELCKQLVNIAVYYNFDGWLINIENEVEPYQIPLLSYFVRNLKDAMHMHIPDSQVIWYDSVLKNGDLLWQNCLNDLNEIFFYNADGILLNYNWTEEDLVNSKLKASHLCTDVYVGNDVFGRGKCFTEGGFSTEKAIKEIKKHGLSAAIFAPGWVYEHLEKKDFKENQFKFWNPIQEIIPPKICGELPYSSSFCPGFGDKMFRNGKVIEDNPWHNMNLQQPQPLYYSTADASITLYSDDAFNGGGCLHLLANVTDEENDVVFNILKTSFYLEDACIISYTFKPLTEVLQVGLCLDMFSHQENYKLFLVSFEKDIPLDSHDSLKYMTPTPIGEILKTGYKIHQESFEEQTWITRVFLLSADVFKQHSIQNISVISSCAKPITSILLGELKVLPVYPTCNLTYEHLTYSCDLDDPQSVDVDCILNWQFHSSISSCDIYVKPLNKARHYVNTTNQTFYHLKCSIGSTPEITVILCRKTFGGENIPDASVRIPLTDGNRCKSCRGLYNTFLFSLGRKGFVKIPHMQENVVIDFLNF